MEKLSEQLRSEGVHVIGDFSGRTGLCQSGRDMVEVFRLLGIPVETLDLPLSPDRMPRSGKLEVPSGVGCPKSRLSIITWNGDVNWILARDLPREMFGGGRKFIGIWYWETQVLPGYLHGGYDLVDEVWATSRFIAESLAPTSPVPIRWFPAPLTAMVLPEVRTVPACVDNDRFVFLFCFDFRSIARRKNPRGVCDAFVRAFPTENPNGPLCVIKTVAGRSEKFLEFAELQARYRHRKDIFFLDGWMPAEERNCLMERANCYVSLHRAEGLGLTMMESMCLGRPCIATGYSGNMDFTTPENSWLVPFKMVQIGEGAPPYPPTDEWAEPDLEAAAAAMVEAYENPQLTAEKGRRAAQTIFENHRMEAVRDQVAALLNEALRTPGSSELAEVASQSKSGVSGRAAAYQILKEARSLRTALRDQWRNSSPARQSRELIQSLNELLKIMDLQQQAQSEILRELGTLKNQMREMAGITAGVPASHELAGRFKLIEAIIASGIDPEALPILDLADERRRRQP